MPASVAVSAEVEEADLAVYDSCSRSGSSSSWPQSLTSHPAAWNMEQPAHFHSFVNFFQMELWVLSESDEGRTRGLSKAGPALRTARFPERKFLVSN